MTSEERVAKLVDPETHFKFLAEELREKLAQANVAYASCVEYGLAPYFYIGPNKTLTYLPDSVIVKRTKVTRY